MLEALRAHHDLKLPASPADAAAAAPTAADIHQPASALAAAVLASATQAALALALTRARTALLLLAHLEGLGLLPAKYLLPFLPPPTRTNHPPASPWPQQAAVALNRAWLLLATSSYPQLAPSPARPPTAAASSASSVGGGIGGGGKALLRSMPLHGRGLSVLEALVLQQGGGLLAAAAPADDSSGDVVVTGALRALAAALPHRLLAFLEGTEQYRYLGPWARGLLDAALLLPEAACGGCDHARLSRKWERLVVYAHLSEARRAAAAHRPQAAERHLAQAVACLRRWGRCLCPPLAYELAGGEGPSGEAEARPPDARDPAQARLAHYVQAVALFEHQSLSGGGGGVGVGGGQQAAAGARRLADVAYAGLREVAPLGEQFLLPPGQGEGEEWAAARWAHRHAAALWATVFRACTDTHAMAGGQLSNQAGQGAGLGAFEEAFLAMRAETRVGAELEELIGAAGGGEGEQAPASGGRGK